LDPQRKKEASLWNRILDTLSHLFYEGFKSLVLTIVIVIILRASILEIYKIPSSTMAPTLYIGDHILVSKLSYGIEIPFSGWFLDSPRKIVEFSKPLRGDVVAFHLKRDVNRFFIKRIIGLPGDRLSMRQGQPFINGKAVSRVLLKKENHLALYQEMAYLIKDNSIDDVKIFQETLPETEHSYLVFSDQRMARFSEMMEQTIPEGHVFVLGDNRNELADSRFFGFVPINRISGKVKWVWLNYSTQNGKFRFLFRRIGTKI